MPKQSTKQLYDQLQIQVAAVNKTANLIGKALGFDESAAPKKQSKIEEILAKNRERYIRNADRRGRKAEQKNS